MKNAILVLATLGGLAACSPASGPGEPRVIARGQDSAYVNRDHLQDHAFAVAVTPDGCQAWIGDNGAEGYAANRYDPKSGLPVCSDRLPKGAVIGNPQQTGFIDILP